MHLFVAHQTEKNRVILILIWLASFARNGRCSFSVRLPELWEVAFLIVTALLLAIINLLIWKFVLRNSSTMSRKLQLFTKHKASDEKRITKAKIGWWFLFGMFFPFSFL